MSAVYQFYKFENCTLIGTLEKADTPNKISGAFENPIYVYRNVSCILLPLWNS